MQLELFEVLGPKKFAGIFIHMASDLRADFYQELDQGRPAEVAALP